MRVNPLRSDIFDKAGPRLAMEILCDAINRRNDRNSNEAHKQAHKYHKRRFNEGWEIFSEILKYTRLLK